MITIICAEITNERGIVMARYTYTLRQEISHQGLNKYRVVTAQNRYELNQKIAAIQAQWDEQWGRKCEAEARKQELEARKRDKEQQKRDIEKAVKFAEDMTKDAVVCLLSQFRKLFQENLFVKIVYIIPLCLSLHVFQKRKSRLL